MNNGEDMLTETKKPGCINPGLVKVPDKLSLLLPIKKEKPKVR